MLWPYLQIVAAWTGGSCGIAIETLKRKLPAKITLILKSWIGLKLGSKTPPYGVS